MTSLQLLTVGFLPSVMQAYIGLVYIYSSLFTPTRTVISTGHGSGRGRSRR